MSSLQVLCQFIIIISLTGQSESMLRPVVTAYPNWNKEGGPLTFTWYKNNVQHGTAKETSTWHAELIHSGDYYCEVNGKYRSDTVTLNITDPGKVAVILQAPATAVYEGDEVYLRCHSPTGYPTGETIFYKNDQMIHISTKDSYVIKSAASTSRYMCSKQVYNFPHTFSDSTYINSGTITNLQVTIPWDKILTGESTTMTCHGGQYGIYHWFHNGVIVGEGQSYTITDVQVGQSGHYHCQTPWGYTSIEFKLEVSNGPVILQATYGAYGLFLRCHSRHNFIVHWTALYKDGKLQRETSGELGPITYPIAYDLSGTYRCEKILSQNTAEMYLDQALIIVRELRPRITVMPDPVVEGDTMTLTCDTTLSPVRADTQLQFAFYRDSWEVKGFSSSGFYIFWIADLKDSGKYFCEIKTKPGGVRKSSQEIPVQIQELFSGPRITVIPDPVVEGDSMTLTCDTALSPFRPDIKLQFAFYRDKRQVQGFSSSGLYEVQSADLKDSGSYFCEIKTIINHVRKTSHEIPIQIQELFSGPRITVIPDPVVEGDSMTLTCDTTLSPLRPHIKLQFAFYRDKRQVQGFSSSDLFKVPSADLKDSGSYFCEIKTIINHVRKTSQEIPIQIQELFSRPNITATPNLMSEGNNTTLTCDSRLSPLRPNTQLQFVFYRGANTQIVQNLSSSNQFVIQSAQKADSGEYFCGVKSSNLDAKMSTTISIHIEVSGGNQTEDYTRENTIRVALAVCVLLIGCCVFIYHMKTEVFTSSNGNNHQG